LEELIRFVDPLLDGLGSRAEVEYAFTILRDGTSADRQLARYEESGGDFNAVVDMLIEETRIGVPDA
jgi:carboxylate-amine ligase